MTDLDFRRLVLRHRHVAPMLSTLLSSTQAALRVTDAADRVILERDAARLGATATERFPVAVEGEVVGWVEGDRVARAVASVLAYASAREADKRSLAREALDRYRELNLVYDLAERLTGELDAAAVTAAAEEEAARLVTGGRAVLTTDAREDGIVGTVRRTGVAEIVADVASDGRATEDERRSVSLAAAPVMAHGEQIGVLAVGTDGRRELTSADLKLLTAIAAIVGPVLDRAHQGSPAVAGTRGAP
jgi:GAF domain-containing protein